MDDKNLDLSFYEVTKWEDCSPYLSNNLIVVCDGCGGAGGFNHKVDKNLIDSFEKIKEVVLPESTDEEFNLIIRDYFEPIFDGPDVERTSAFWASRIAMSRYAYYMKTSPIVNLDECKNFVKKGMVDVKNKFNLNEPEVSSQRMLPTTMVSIFVKNEDENNIDIDVNWAGDSRAYVLNKDGLKQLSIDDESKDGGLTNYFSGRDDFETKINHREYKLEKPCVIFVCSDGLFDNFKSLDFEYILLQGLECSASMEEYKTFLMNFYNSHKDDDCTMSLLSFGFADYEGIKSYFAEREAYVTNLFNKYKENEFAILLKQDPAIYDDAFGKVLNRTRDKLVSICNEVSNNQEDPNTNELISEEIKNKLNEELAKKEKEIQDSLYKLESDYSESIKKYLVDNVLSIDLYDVFNEKSFGQIENLLKEYKNLLDSREEFKSEWLKDTELKGEYINLSNSLKNHLNKIFDVVLELNAFRAPFFGSDYNKLKAKLFKQIEDGEIEVKNISKILDIVCSLGGNANFKDEFSKALEDYKKVKSKNYTEEQVQNYKKKELENIVLDIYDILQGKLEFFKESTKDEQLNKLLSDYNFKSNKLKTDGISFENQLMTYLSNDENLKVFVTNRLKIGEKPTYIDQFYNPSALNKAINYYEALNNNAEEIDKLLEEYKKYNEGVDSLISDSNIETV